MIDKILRQLFQQGILGQLFPDLHQHTKNNLYICIYVILLISSCIAFIEFAAKRFTVLSKYGPLPQARCTIDTGGIKWSLEKHWQDR